MPTKTYTVPVRVALTEAEAIIKDVCVSIASITDRGDARIDSMERTRILRESLRKLQSISIPGPPEPIAEQQVEFLQYTTAHKRGLSRRDRCNNVSYALRAVLELSFRTVVSQPEFDIALADTIHLLETVQFPSMFHKKRESDSAE